MLGVLGGMGPMATVDFLRQLTDVVVARRDQDHPQLVLYSDPGTPDRTAALVDDGPSPLPAMQDGVRFLEASGAEAIAIPCNSAHAWYDQLAAEAEVPLLHIADSVVERLRGLGVAAGARVGVLSTEGTRQMGLYSTRLRLAGLAPVVPEAELMVARVSPGIAAVKAGDLERGARLLREAADELCARGAVVVVLGCTDISVVLHEHDPDITFVDSNRSLARSAAQRLGYPVRG